MTRDVILFLSRDDDGEVQALRHLLPKTCCLLLDDEWLVRNEVLEWESGPERSPILRVGDRLLDQGTVRSVFVRPRYRRRLDGTLTPHYVLPHPTVSDSDRYFVQAESESFLLGGLLALGGLWVNHPSAEVLASQKLNQLELAKEAGLRIPDSIVSSNPASLREFWHRHQGQVITKALSPNPSRVIVKGDVITRHVLRGHLELLDKASPCPTYFQELIPGGFDIRATVVGDDLFAIAIQSQKGSSPLDWRLDYTVPMSPITLEESVRQAVMDVATRLGLSLCAADLRVTPDGEPVFLEINSNCAFLFVELIGRNSIVKPIAPRGLTLLHDSCPIVYLMGVTQPTRRLEDRISEPAPWTTSRASVA